MNNHEKSVSNKSGQAHTDWSMHPAFANIEFGPFNAAYHRESINGGMKEAFFAFLETCLLPQPGQAPIFETARLRAQFDDDKYCGPNSAVRDRYIFDCTFNLAEGQKHRLRPTRSPVAPEVIQIGFFEMQKYNGPHSEVMDFYVAKASVPEHPRSESLFFDVKTRTFSTTRPFLFWPLARMERHREQWPAIERLCRDLIKREATGGICPVCLRELQIAESSTEFNVRCPMNCFECNYDAQNNTGKFLHGHYLESEMLEME